VTRADKVVSGPVVRRATAAPDTVLPARTPTHGAATHSRAPTQVHRLRCSSLLCASCRPTSISSLTANVGQPFSCRLPSLSGLMMQWSGCWTHDATQRLRDRLLAVSFSGNNLFTHMWLMCLCHQTVLLISVIGRTVMPRGWLRM